MATNRKNDGNIGETNTMSPKDLALLREDAEKWRDWTKGEYRLICKKKYAQFVEAYKALHPKKGRAYTVIIPKKCNGCNSVTFYVWGTKYPNKTRIEVRCMRCGKPQQQTGSTP